MSSEELASRLDLEEGKRMEPNAAVRLKSLQMGTGRKQEGTSPFALPSCLRFLQGLECGRSNNRYILEPSPQEASCLPTHLLELP